MPKNILINLYITVSINKNNNPDIAAAAITKEDIITASLLLGHLTLSNSCFTSLKKLTAFTTKSIKNQSASN